MCDFFHSTEWLWDSAMLFVACICFITIFSHSSLLLYSSHCVNMQFIYPFYFWFTFGWFSVVGYYEKNFYEHPSISFCWTHVCFSNYLGVGLLGCRLGVYLVLVDTISFLKWLHYFTLSPAMYDNSGCFTLSTALDKWKLIFVLDFLVGV